MNSALKLFSNVDKLLFVLNTVFFAVLMFSLVFTFKNYKNYKNQTEQLDLRSNNIDRINSYANQIKAVRSNIADSNIVSSDNFRTILLKEISIFNLRVESIQKEKIDSTSNIEISTSKITLSGTFKQLVQFVYHIEYLKKMGMIISGKFYKKKLFGTGNTIYVDLVIKNLST